MKLVFHLSGEHETLPKSEVLAVLDQRRLGIEVLHDLEQILICNAKFDHSNLMRLAMTHEILEFKGFCKPIKSKIVDLAARMGPVESAFSVGLTRIKKYWEDLRTLELERMIGGAVDGEKVDLDNPTVRIRGFLTSEGFVLGKSICRFRRSEFNARNPHLRPFFHPSSLSPILSRAISNICGVSEGKLVLDPFCGTGGLLIEAGLLGAEIFGLDIDEKMVAGTKENLLFYGLEGDVKVGDSTELGLRDCFDIVISDPPYGRGSTTRGRGINALYNRAMKSIYRALKNEGIACVISPSSLNIEEIAMNTGFKVQQKHLLRVHKSLTRNIVFMKK
jgi:tRNA (guanine10-N2)-dimethyltransferase